MRQPVPSSGNSGIIRVPVALKSWYNESRENSDDLVVYGGDRYRWQSDPEKPVDFRSSVRFHGSPTGAASSGTTPGTTGRSGLSRTALTKTSPNLAACSSGNRISTAGLSNSNKNAAGTTTERRCFGSPARSRRRQHGSGGSTSWILTASVARSRDDGPFA